MKHSILNKIFICLALLTSGQALFAQVETAALSEQIKTCKSNAAMNWDSTLNRCVYKKQDIQTQNQVAECGKIADKAAREKCFLNIAENKSGLSSDTDKIYDSGTTKSMVMNGAVSAYYVVDLLNKKFAKDSGASVPSEKPEAASGESSTVEKANSDEAQSSATSEKAKDTNETSKSSKNCMSKQILGMTGVAGLATDVWMKMQTKKKMAELKKSYQVDLENSAYDGQKKAFEYLLKEQETVKEMAGLEKKRNLALMAGYGAALAMSVWETFFNQDPQCKFIDTK